MFSDAIDVSYIKLNEISPTFCIVKRWGMGNKILLYKTMLCPTLFCCAQIWVSVAKTSNKKSRFCKIRFFEALSVHRDTKRKKKKNYQPLQCQNFTDQICHQNQASKFFNSIPNVPNSDSYNMSVYDELAQ